MTDKITGERITITAHDAGATGEYHAHVEGHAEIGRLTWVARNGVAHGRARIVEQRIAEHTLVPDQIGGRGVAARLVAAFVADARAQGFRIVPACSYVAAAFARHPEWGDLLAE